MKYILLSVFGLLVLATIADRLSRQPDESDVPVLYWVTDASPARLAELELFYVWLEENDYPRFEIRLDNTNKDISKKLIQGVSGVGADIISMARDEAWLLHATGMMEDLVPLAQKHGFTVDETWPAAAPTFLIDGEQVGFPGAIPCRFISSIPTFSRSTVSPCRPRSGRSKNSKRRVRHLSPRPMRARSGKRCFFAIRSTR